MSSYVIGDVHGGYDALMALLEEIRFSEGDRLLFVGDYIDRGAQSYEVLRFLQARGENVLCVRGNHDEAFLGYVARLMELRQRRMPNLDEHSHQDFTALYKAASYLFRLRQAALGQPFDSYRTLERFSRDSRVCFADLLAWAEMIAGMPYFIKTQSGQRPCVIVHAGYREEGFRTAQEARDFCLWARADALRLGGLPHGMIVAGHTPTILPGEPTYTGGAVFRHYDAAKDCVFYDIDCGSVFRARYPESRLAALRLEDERVFYA